MYRFVAFRSRRRSTSHAVNRSVIARSFVDIMAIAVLAICAMPLCAATLDPALQGKVQAATFEVVIAKPVDDPLTYEKPLPLDLLPFQFRNDKYFSVGTAFAIGGGRFVTAAHVFAIGVGGLWTAPALRDGAGHVYQIAQIEKYSAHEDFVVFTLATQPAAAKVLEINRKPVLNETVYSVGNALGEGVVIRDGLYTSDTPEAQDGRWKWLRFSAAASPGNSGGPLLDKNGKVIGIVLMKSPNENLNYAVSIDQVLQAPDHLARIDTRGQFRSDVFDTLKTLPFKQEFALPKSFADFAATSAKLSDEFASHGLHELFAENAADIFPRGAGSSRVLHANYGQVVPGFIVRGDDTVWHIETPHYAHADLSANGSVESAQFNSQLLLHLHAPDNVMPSKLHGDAQAYLDLSLKALPLSRPVGTDKVKITSLGKPSEDGKFTDAWGRVWQSRVWPLAYDNSVLISLDLPVPDGYVSMRRLVHASGKTQQLEEMKSLADFIALSYAGTLEQWQSFLAESTLLPPALSPTLIQFEFDKRFAWQSPRFAFSYTSALQKIDKDNRLFVDLGFFLDAGKPVCDVTGLVMHEEAEGKTDIGAFRHAAPSGDLDEKYRKNWTQLWHREHPYDGIAQDQDNLRVIYAVAGSTDTKTEPAVLYTFRYRSDGGTAQDKMKAKLDLLMKNVRVDDH